MEIRSFLHPTQKFEVLKYYWPESLRGESNFAGKSFNALTETHHPVTREDGTRTCSCGLVYWGTSDIPLQSLGFRLDEIGHRNHQTGDFEPVYKTIVRDGSSPENQHFICEWCGSSSSVGTFFDDSRSHNCDLENNPESREIWITAMLEMQGKNFSLPTFDKWINDLYVGSLKIELTIEGATVSPFSPDFVSDLTNLLEGGPLLMSEEVRRGANSSDQFDWPLDYINPTQEEFDAFWKDEIASDAKYWITPKVEDWGLYKFSASEVQSNSLVRYVMTKDEFVINAPRSNVPQMRMPVKGLI
jgi:hypothetical protein